MFNSADIVNIYSSYYTEQKYKAIGVVQYYLKTSSYFRTLPQKKTRL